jgi:putative ABC transport system substrate-binding protein
MKRRDFIAMMAAVASATPSITAAQTKRIGRVAMLVAADGQVRVNAVRGRLAQLGWIEGQNLKFDPRISQPDPTQLKHYAMELVRLEPDVILVGGSATVAALLQQTRTIPIVFATVADPIGNGFIASFARPGGNVTGFSVFEGSMSGKWLELLKELAPRTTRVIALYHAANTAVTTSHYLTPLEQAASLFGFEVTPGRAQNSSDIEPLFARFADNKPNGGIIVLSSPFVFENRELIASSAIRNRLPVINPYRDATIVGGLASYGIDQVTEYRSAATYVDRILRGEKPADLPVQQPTKFELVINLKTAKALGLEIPPMLLARADEVIE